MKKFVLPPTILKIIKTRTLWTRLQYKMINQTYVYHHAIILKTNRNFFDISFDIQPPETNENIIKVSINNKFINIITLSENDYHVVEIYDESITDGNLIENFTIRGDAVFNEEWHKLIPKCYEYSHRFLKPYTIEL